MSANYVLMMRLVYPNGVHKEMKYQACDNIFRVRARGSNSDLDGYHLASLYDWEMYQKEIS